MTETIKITRNGVEAEVIDRYVGEFLKDGWVKVGVKTDDPIVSELESKINASESKDEIELLIKDSFGVDLDKRGNIETVREKAISIVRDSQPE